MRLILAAAILTASTLVQGLQYYNVYGRDLGRLHERDFLEELDTREIDELFDLWARDLLNVRGVGPSRMESLRKKLKFTLKNPVKLESAKQEPNQDKKQKDELQKLQVAPLKHLSEEEDIKKYLVGGSAGVQGKADRQAAQRGSRNGRRSLT